MDVQLTSRLGGKRSHIPNEIRRYRIQAGLSQRKLGGLIGRGRSVISSWERGHSLPTLKNAMRLSTALGTLVESLFYGLYSAAKRGDRKPNEG